LARLHSVGKISCADTDNTTSLLLLTLQNTDQKIGHINSFFDLEAQDIDEKLLKFDQFKGQVTVITNVASYCGYTESHYKGLNKLYAKFQGSKIPLNILAFPCNQFGEQE
jgi:hypothetical protein